MTVKTSAARLAAESAARRDARTRKIMRVVGIIGTALVWGVALINSYFHITALASEHGQSQFAAHTLPAAIDGLMIVSSVAMVAYRTALFPKVMFGVGACATIVANVLSVRHADPIGYGVAGFYAVALIGSAVLLERLCLGTHGPDRQAETIKKLRAELRTARKAVQRPVDMIDTRAVSKVPARPVHAAA